MSPVSVVVDATSVRPAPLTPPLSKSDAHRAITLGALLGESPRLTNAGPLPSDVVVLRDGLARLAGPGEVAVDCADGGAPFRILLTQAALRPGLRTRFTGTPRLGERPHGPLLDALASTLGPTGFRAEAEGRPWPLVVTGAARAATPRFTIDGSASSQYASSLLLGAAALCLKEGRPWMVEMTGAATSEGYLALTEGWLTRAGFRLVREGRAVSVVDHHPALLPAVPGDWSSIGYLALVAWRSGGTVRAADPEALHPDRALLRILDEVGLRWTVTPEGLTVTGTPRTGLTASGTECPDLLPTLAALACVLPAPSTLHAVSILRDKESDRLAGIQAMAAAAGARTVLDGDTLTLHPPATPVPALSLESREDHRLAMAGATLAVLTGARLTLEGPECVRKSFPGFWEELARAGVKLLPAA